MAPLSRKINGHYAMLSRQDGENIFIMFSDMLHFWYDKRVLVRPPSLGNSSNWANWVAD